jgi:hypothetical protein
MNNRQPRREDGTTKASKRNRKAKQYGTFAANRQQTATLKKKFRGKGASGNVFGLVGC